MNTNYNNNVDGALKLMTINGSTYQIGKDASNTEGGISKLFNNFETYKAATDGSYDAKTVYDEIAGIKEIIGADAETPIAEQVADIQDAIGEGFDENNTVADAVAEAKTVVAQAANDYITVSSAADANDGHMVYTIGTSGIDSAISTAVSNAVDGIVAGAPETFDTLKEISDWITEDQTGAAAILADVANKANKSEMSVVAGTGADVDKTTITLKEGTSATVLTAHQDISGKKDLQNAVSDPTANGNAAAFIDTISQNANGEITVTKKNVQAASASQAGLMSAAHYSKLEAISASVNGETLTITTQAAA